MLLPCRNIPLDPIELSGKAGLVLFNPIHSIDLPLRYLICVKVKLTFPYQPTSPPLSILGTSVVERM